MVKFILLIAASFLLEVASALIGYSFTATFLGALIPAVICSALIIILLFVLEVDDDFVSEAITEIKEYSKKE